MRVKQTAENEEEEERRGKQKTNYHFKLDCLESCGELQMNKGSR